MFIFMLMLFCVCFLNHGHKSVQMAGEYRSSHLSYVDKKNQYIKHL